MTETDPTTITRVALRNQEHCGLRQVDAAHLSRRSQRFRKSNFLDALRFTAQALRFSPGHALYERGGINEVRRRSRGHPNHFGMLDLRLSRRLGTLSKSAPAQKGGTSSDGKNALFNRENPNRRLLQDRKRPAPARFHFASTPHGRQRPALSLTGIGIPGVPAGLRYVGRNGVLQPQSGADPGAPVAGSLTSSNRMAAISPACSRT